MSILLFRSFHAPQQLKKYSSSSEGFRLYMGIKYALLDKNYQFIKNTLVENKLE